MNVTNIAGAPTLRPELSTVRRWWPVALLCLLYIISLIDRLILAILIEPLKQDLLLSDTQVALLIGSSFAIFYSIVGIPVAWALDKGNRLWIATVGVSIWSLATIASGWAEHFMLLVALRIGVAIGESVLSPFAVSLIADLFPRRNRSAPMALFMASGIIGIFAAYSIGGGVVALLEKGLLEGVPLIGGLPTWRATLVLIGIPGLVLALLMICTIHVPERRVDTGNQDEGSLDRYGAFASARDMWRFYFFFFLGVGIIALPTNAALTWYPALLTRVFGLSIAESGYAFSLSLGAAAVVLLLVPQIMRLCERRGMRASLVPIMLIIAPIGSLFFGLSLVQDSAATTLHYLIVGYGLLTGGVNALPTIAIGLTAPAAYRGRIVAIGLASISLVGMGLGPYFAGVLADHVFVGPRAIANALLLLTAVAAPFAITSLYLSWFPFRRALQQ